MVFASLPDPQAPARAGGPMTVKDRKRMCALLGLDYSGILVASGRGLDPKRPNGWTWRVSHPRVGEAFGVVELDAWHRFFDRADRRLGRHAAKRWGV